MRTSFSAILRQFRGHCPTLGAIISNKKFSRTTDLIIVNVFIRWLAFTTYFIRKAHWIIANEPAERRREAGEAAAL